MQHQWLSWLLRLFSSLPHGNRACRASNSISKRTVCALLVLLWQWLWLEVAGNHALRPAVPVLRLLLLSLLKAYSGKAEA